jgi:hypothetical protein
MTLSPANLRILAAVPRSGSTLFMRVMAEHSKVAVTSRNILMGNMGPRPKDKNKRRDFYPDYSIFSNPDHPVFRVATNMGKMLIVSKEEYGNDRFTGSETLNECNYSLFPSISAIEQTKPVFTFRRPDHVFDSWLARGWNDLESFLIAYKTHIRTFQTARSVRPETFFYTYEQMTNTRQSQEAVFRKICESWDLEFDREILDFKTPLGHNFIYASERERGTYKGGNPKGIFDTLLRSTTIRSDIKPHGLLTAEHRDCIACELMPAYQEICGKAQRFFSRPIAARSTMSPPSLS